MKRAGQAGQSAGRRRLLLGTDRPSGWAFPARTAAALLAAVVLLLLAASPAGAAIYRGGGKGVRLAVRVVHRQIVWAKVNVREHCYSTRRGYYEHTEVLEGLILPVAIGRKGAFSWAFKAHTKKGFRSVTVQNISGRIRSGGLVGRLLYYNWFSFTDDEGTPLSGNCHGGADTKAFERPKPVTISARRGAERRGVAFYYSEKEKGIRTLFEVRGHWIIRAETVARLYCTDPEGGRYFDFEFQDWFVPVEVGPGGRLEMGEVQDELPFQLMVGEISPDRIVGSYGYAYASREEGRCRSGSFDPGHGDWTIPFVALRR
jgi:hypothetical protein